MYPPKLYSGPTIQSRSAARRAAQDLVKKKEIYLRALKTSSSDQFGEITFPTSSGLSTVNILAEYMVHWTISNGLCLCALLSLYLFCFWRNSKSIKR